MTARPSGWEKKAMSEITDGAHTRIPPTLADRIAARVREVDGDHTLGAGSLGDALVPLVREVQSEMLRDLARALIGPGGPAGMMSLNGDQRASVWTWIRALADGIEGPDPIEAEEGLAIGLEADPEYFEAQQ